MKMKKIKMYIAPAFLTALYLILILSCSGGGSGPQGIGNHSMAYDTESNKIILFGGQLNEFDTTQLRNWTWAYDPETEKWEKLEPKVRPPKVFSSVMAYDIESDRIVLFVGETWTFDYNSKIWKKKNPSMQPPSFTGAKAAYDSESDRIILFGGQLSNDTWAYDENTDVWEKMDPPNRPLPREYHSMTYDPEADRVVLFGGGASFTDGTYYNDVYGDTWIYDYNTDTWKECAASGPERRVYHDIAYVDELGTAVLFGGLSDDRMKPVKPYLWAFDCGVEEWARLEFREPLKPRRKYTMAALPGTPALLLIGGISAPAVPPAAPRYTNDVVTVSFTITK